MTPAVLRSRAVLLHLLLLLPAAAAAQEPARSPVPDSFAMPGVVRFRADEQTASENELRLSGYVDIEMGEARILADLVVYRRDAGIVEATGNVVLSFPGAVLTGTRALYRVATQTGEIDDAVGYLERDNAILRARKIERIGPERLRVEDAVFTTCTQPVPYWSFRLGRGTFDLGSYAYLHNVAFRAKGAPLFWSPYLVWPIKEGRAAGLLFPEFGNSNKLGTEFRQPFYWPFADNADLTLWFNGYTKVGLGLTAELEWLPTHSGWSLGRVNFISDRVQRKNRYLVEWSQRQPLGWQTDLTASLRHVSDFDYFTDYETDLALATSPQTNSVVELTRNWSWYTLSARARRYEQFFPGVAGDGTSLLRSKAIQDTLPQVELRGRSQQLGRAPLFLSFESSGSFFRRRILAAPEDRLGVPSEDELVSRVSSSWGRADLAPQLQAPVLKEPWGDLTLNAGWRGTYWTGSTDPSDAQRVLSDSVYRNLWSAGFVFQGPRVQRIFDTPRWDFSPKLKHVIEPFADYRWSPESAVSSSEIPFVDQIDQIGGGEVSDVSYGIRQRFLALRRPDTGRAPTLVTVEETSLEALEEETKRLEENGAPEEERLAVDDTAGPVEIASVELSQAYSFARPLSQEYLLDASGNIVRDPETNAPLTEPSYFSPLRLRVRLNPTAERVVDASAVWDTANEVLTETSLSGLVRLSPLAFVQASWFRRVPVAPGLQDRESTVRSRWEVMSSSRRVGLATEWDWDVANDRLEHQQYQLRLATQCCSFRFGYDRRDFVGNFREEYSIVVDLTGIGEVLDLVDSD